MRLRSALDSTFPLLPHHFTGSFWPGEDRGLSARLTSEFWAAFINLARLRPNSSSPLPLPLLHFPASVLCFCSPSVIAFPLYPAICILWLSLGQGQCSSFQISPFLALPGSFHRTPATFSFLTDSPLDLYLLTPPSTI